MQIVYATHLELPGEGAQALKDALSEVANWVKAEYDVALEPLVGGQASNSEATINWSHLDGPSGAIVSIWTEHPDKSDSTWHWLTLIDVGAEPGASWLRVRLGLSSLVEGRVTSPKVKPARPDLVRRLVDQLPVRLDNWPLDEYFEIPAAQIPQLLEFLTDTTRRLPVVALSLDRAGAAFLKPSQITDELLGLAHVIVLSRSASFALGEALPKQLGCYGGAVRVYWPGFAATDDPYHHELFVKGRLDFLGQQGVRDELFSSLGKLAALSIDEHPLRRRLKVEVRQAEQARLERERLETRERLEAAANDPRAKFDEFVEEFDAMQERLSAAENDLLDALIMNEDLAREVANVRAQAAKDVQNSMNLSLPEFADEEQGFRFAVTVAWAKRTPVAEQRDRPMGEFKIGPRFISSLQEIKDVSIEKVADVVFEIVTNRVHDLPGRDSHQLRASGAGSAPYVRRAEDGATCWRAALQKNTPQARRIHWWSGPQGVELSRIVLHDDFTP